MRLIVGLGNPGDKYKNTRHNLGFRVVDKMAEDGRWKTEDGKDMVIYRRECRDALQCVSTCVSTIWAIKPQTYMNDSGQVVKKIVDYYKIKPVDICVIHDDLDLELGQIKTQKSRGSAGHKGVQSIIDSLGTNDFTRVRLGIGRPPKGAEPDDFVLQNFDKSEFPQLKAMIGEAVSFLKNLIFQE